MKICVLAADVSQNCMGRAYVLSRVLQRRYDVEIVGPLRGSGIWRPVARMRDVRIRPIRTGRAWLARPQIGPLVGAIDGDVVYASKALATSFGAGLIWKLRSRRPLVLDMDDWEVGLHRLDAPAGDLTARIKRWGWYAVSTVQNPNSYTSALVLERLVRFADAITVASTGLQARFGGEIVWHGRDIEDFDPSRHNGAETRATWGMRADRRVVMFFGTVRPHKGVEDLIEAVGLLDDAQVILVLAGISDGPYDQAISALARSKLAERVLLMGEQSFDHVPRFLAAADLVVIPQRKGWSSMDQVPAKVFDAIAMAKPVIATNVSDLPRILQGCGWIVEPENPAALARAIEYAINHPAEAREFGRKARERCVALYSWDAMERTLASVFGQYD